MEYLLICYTKVIVSAKNNCRNCSMLESLEKNYGNSKEKRTGKETIRRRTEEVRFVTGRGELYDDNISAA